LEEFELEHPIKLIPVINANVMTIRNTFFIINNLLKFNNLCILLYIILE